MKQPSIPIGDLLLHKPPMRMVDELLEVLDEGVCCEVTIKDSDLFVTPQGVPAYVSVEYMAQTIGVYDGWGRLQRKSEPRLGYLVGTRKLELHCDFFQIGQRLLIEAAVGWDGGQLVQFSCTTKDSQTNGLLASAVLNVYSPGRESVEE